MHCVTNRLTDDSVVRNIKKTNNVVYKERLCFVKYIVLFFISIVAFLFRIHPIIKYEMLIHEFDPQFNYRVTEYLANNGFQQLWNWFDEQAWYPIGRLVGQTFYPGLMVSAYIIYKILTVCGIMLTLKQVCVLIGPLFSILSSFSIYGLTKLCFNSATIGMLASLVLSMNISYINRSASGSYDNESVSIFAIINAFHTFLNAVQKKTLGSLLIACISYCYIIYCWGGYMFVSNIVPVYMLILLLYRQLDLNHSFVYIIWHIAGTLCCLNLPMVGYYSIYSYEHLLSHVVAIICTLHLFLSNCKPSIHFNFNKTRLTILLLAIASLTSLVLYQFDYLVISRRALTLILPNKIINSVPLVASIAEHRSTSVFSFINQNGFLVILVPIALYNVSNRQKKKFISFIPISFLICLWCSHIMIRFLLVFSPIYSAIVAFGTVCIFAQLYKLFAESKKITHLIYIVIVFISIAAVYFHNVSMNSLITSMYYSNPTIISSHNYQLYGTYNDEFREAYSWLQHNTEPKARIGSWWDYGYQTTLYTNRTTIVDNNTWNYTHIATMGAIIALDERSSAYAARKLDLNYIFVVCGSLNGNSADDLNKFGWISRIATHEFKAMPTDYWNYNQYSYGDKATDTLKKSMMYKFCYKDFKKNQITKGYDIVRRIQINTEPELTEFEEAYSTTTQFIRIYKVKNEIDVLPINNKKIIKLIQE